MSRDAIASTPRTASAPPAIHNSYSLACGIERPYIGCKMRLTIFGATGRTGQLLVRQALGAGHWVTAYSRTPSKLRITDKNLLLIEGELDDYPAICRAVAGSDAIISALGPGTRAAGSPLVPGMGTIIRAMEHVGVSRAVILSTVSVRDALDQPHWLIETLVRIIRLVFPTAYEEIIRMAQVISASSLQWTLVRVSLLTNRHLTRRVVTAYPGTRGLRLFISRADLAWFMLKETQEPRFIRAMPAVSN